MKIMEKVRKTISDYIRKGEATVRKRDAPSKFVTITQGDARFFGSYGESPNGVFLIAFSDGHIQRIGNEEKWVDGQVCLVKNLETVLWSRRLERPNDGAVSNNGIVVINDWLKMKKLLGGKFHIFDQSGRILVEKQFNSNLGTCAISKDGNHAVVSTLSPDNSIHFFDIRNGNWRWSYKNHSREPVLGLSISDGKVEIWTGKSEATKKYNYSLDFEGGLTKEDVEKLEKVRAISKGRIEDSISLLVEFLRSPDKNQIRRGLKELRALTRRFRKYGSKLAPHVTPYLMDDDEEISQLSEDIILKLGESDPSAIEPAVSILLRRIERHPRKYRENDLRTLGLLGRIKPEWIKDRIPIMIRDLSSSTGWNARRFAAFALGMIGSVEPESVREAVPILTKYLSDAKWWLSKIKERAEQDLKVAVDLNVAYGMGADPEVWVRNAAIQALGDIGEQNPDIVKAAIPAIISCLKRPQPYTRKRAVVALGQIAKTGRSYIRPAIPMLETIANEDSDKKVRLEAKRLLESISPQVAERSITSIPNLISSLSAENELSRYRSIRELERMFYGRPSLPEQYYYKALLLMNEASSDLARCIEKIEQELKTSQDETTRLLLLESLMMAKRTFLEFIVGKYVSINSIQCKFCDKVYKANGLRSHLSRTHPEKWKNIRPYNEIIQQHLENKNQTGLPSDEWERQLLEKYQKISRTNN